LFGPAVIERLTLSTRPALLELRRELRFDATEVLVRALPDEV